MRLIATKGTKKLYEQQGLAVIEDGEERLRPGVSVQAVLARGYWQVVPRTVSFDDALRGDAP